MATSGTYAFTVTRDDIIAAALRTLGAFGVNDTIPPNDITNCAQALNILVKSLVKKGLPLWCVQTVNQPCVIAQMDYVMGPANVSSPLRPLRILNAFLRDPTGNDVQLQVVSRYDYNNLGLKSSPGIPNQLMYDPQATQGVVTLYNVPNLAGYTLYTTIQRQIQDFNLSTDNPDMPQEAFQALKWALADELALEYGSPQMNYQQVQAKAVGYMNELMDFEQEQASVYFTPSMRSR